MPWFVACCARSSDLRHPAAVVAWHLLCVVARGVPLWRVSWPCGSRRSGWLSLRRGALPHAGGLRPRLYWVAARGTRRPAQNRAHCASRWQPLRRGWWARSASYLFAARLWDCPWRVPRASVLGCVRFGGWRVRTRSLTRLVFRAVGRSTGNSATAPGLFRVGADTSHCGSEDATPGSRACVRVPVLPGGSGGPASRARSGAPHLPLWPLCLPALLSPLRAWVASFPFLCLPLLVALFPLCTSVVSCFLWFPAPGALGLGALFFFPPPPRLVFFFSSCPLCAPVVSGFLWFPAPGALALGAVSCLFCWSAATRLSVRSRCFCVSCLAVRCSSVVAAPPPPPPPLLCLAVTGKLRIFEVLKVYFFLCSKTWRKRGVRSSTQFQRTSRNYERRKRLQKSSKSIVLGLRVHNKPFYPCLAFQNQIVLNEFLHSN